MTLEDFLKAAYDGREEVVSAALAEDPSLAQAAGPYDKTALHWAAENDRMDVARTLLGAGADLEARTSWGATPFEWAAHMGRRAVAELLLQRGAAGHSLVTAASLGRMEDVQRFLEGPCSVEDISKAFHQACRNGATDVAEFLLARGADVDATGFWGATGLHWAAVNGHEETVRFLVENGADFARRDPQFGSPPEGWAREGGHEEIARYLHEAAASRG